MKRLRTVLVGLAVAGAAILVTDGGASATGSGRTLADVLLADAGRDDAAGFDKRWFDYDIVTQAVLLFPDLVAAASDPDA